MTAIDLETVEERYAISITVPVVVILIIKFIGTSTAYIGLAGNHILLHIINIESKV